MQTPPYCDCEGRSGCLWKIKRAIEGCQRKLSCACQAHSFLCYLRSVSCQQSNGTFKGGGLKGQIPFIRDWADWSYDVRRPFQHFDTVQWYRAVQYFSTQIGHTYHSKQWVWWAIQHRIEVQQNEIYEKISCILSWKDCRRHSSKTY